MAEKEKEHDDKSAESGEKKKSGNMLLIIIIIVLVLLLVIGGIVAMLMLGNHDAEPAAENGTKKEASAHPEQEAPAKEEHSSEGGHASVGGTEVGLMFPLESFTVNLLSESGRRYLKVEMNLEIEGEELSPELEEKKPIFRDIIIRLLSSKSLEEISTVKGKEKIKDEIVSEINTRLKDGKVLNVYFTDFVVQ
ncbi:MAG: flagellar basal body-associated protein FliL [Sulfuricurvum sp.]|jgi:flagellar FliL protein|uniref:flagellar basal body-associated protein FliL n=1 Tax=Sulfuricurvum sp. TaxID=2025608 RepID=UPI0025D6279A|nr:flagellar basal body-associated protein FliL [Sulfuricurvum sp.]MCK9373234.1 flagellar basal body-associated protein FliL [Sulfuricurvum sp.]